MANATNTTAGPPIPLFVPSVIQLNEYSQLYVAQADIQIAPWVMGAMADLFLQGILAAQTANYFNYRDAENSQRRFTWLVIFLAVLCCLKTSQNIVIVWDTVISTFANPDLSSILVATLWSHYTTSLSTAIIAIFCQSFFVYRYWMLTRRWYVCVCMLAGMVVSLVGAILVIVYIPRFDNPTVKVWSLVHFVAAITVDTLITVGTAWHLQSRKSSIQSTSEMIDRLVRMTWQTALPPTICVIINAAVLQSRGLDLVHIAFNMVLPKLYAISLMYTLNIRNEMRGERTSHERSTGSRTHPVSVSGKQSFMPNASTYRHGNGGPSMGGMEAGAGSPAEKRGVSFIGGGKGRGLSFSGRHDASGRRIDGIHVETQISRDGGASQGSGNTMELRPFHGDDIKVQPSSEFDREVWDQDHKYNAQ